MKFKPFKRNSVRSYSEDRTMLFEDLVPLLLANVGLPFTDKQLEALKHTTSITSVLTDLQYKELDAIMSSGKKVQVLFNMDGTPLIGLR